MHTTHTLLSDDDLWDQLADKNGAKPRNPAIAADPRIEDWYLNGWIALYGNRWRTVLADRPWTSTPKEQP